MNNELNRILIALKKSGQSSMLYPDLCYVFQFFFLLEYMLSIIDSSKAIVHSFTL